MTLAEPFSAWKCITCMPKSRHQICISLRAYIHVHVHTCIVRYKVHVYIHIINEAETRLNVHAYWNVKKYCRYKFTYLPMFS